MSSVAPVARTVSGGPQLVTAAENDVPRTVLPAQQRATAAIILYPAGDRIVIDDHHRFDRERRIRPLPGLAHQLPDFGLITRAVLRLGDGSPKAANNAARKTHASR